MVEYVSTVCVKIAQSVCTTAHACIQAQVPSCLCARICAFVSVFPNFQYVRALNGSQTHTHANTQAYIHILKCRISYKYYIYIYVHIHKYTQDPLPTHYGGEGTCRHVVFLGVEGAKLALLLVVVDRAYEHDHNNLHTGQSLSSCFSIVCVRMCAHRHVTRLSTVRCKHTAEVLIFNHGNMTRHIHTDARSSHQCLHTFRPCMSFGKAHFLLVK